MQSMLKRNADERMSAEVFPFDVNVGPALDRADMQWEQTMPSDYKYGAPLGNGDFGCCVYGQPRELCFAFGKNDVWDRVNDGSDGFPGKNFDELRQTYFDADDETFAKILEEIGRHEPAKPTDTKYYQLLDAYGRQRDSHRAHQTTCGTLRLHLDEAHNPDKLKMRVHLHDGEWSMQYQFGRQLTAFCSRSHQVFALEMERGHQDPDPWDIGETYDYNEPLTVLPWEFARGEDERNPPMTWETHGDGMVLGTQTFVAGGHYVIGVRVCGFAHEEFADLHGRMNAVAHGIESGKFQLYMTIVSHEDSEDAAGEAVRRLEAAKAAGFDALREANRQWWHDYWQMGLAAVADDQVATPYYRSLYMNGSTVGEGFQSAGLQGVWCGENQPVWNGDYHSNINVQCMYWGLYTNNRLSFVEPLLRLYDGMKDHAREIVRDYFQMRGLKFPHAGSIGGYEMSGATGCHYSTDPCESVWIVQMFMDYYEYSGDEDFLREIAYPLIRDVALFLADYLVRDDERNCWVPDPVVHFETQDGKFGVWGSNSLWAAAWFRCGLQQAMTAAEILHVDDALREEWQDRLANLAPLPVADEGYWKAWEDVPPTYRGHNFMLIPVFPCGICSAEHGPDAWREQAKATWQELVRLNFPSGSGGQWCGGEGISELVRIGERDLAFARSRWDMTNQINGFNHGYGGFGGCFHQADHVVGYNRVLADFCLMTMGDTVHVFYGIPEDTPARFFSLRTKGGYLVSADKRGKAVDYILVQATWQTQLKIALPWAKTSCRKLDGSGEAQVVDTSVATFALERGNVYLLSPPEFDLSGLDEVAFGDFAIKDSIDDERG